MFLCRGVLTIEIDFIMESMIMKLRHTCIVLALAIVRHSYCVCGLVADILLHDIGCGVTFSVVRSLRFSVNCGMLISTTFRPAHYSQGCLSRWPILLVYRNYATTGLPRLSETVSLAVGGNGFVQLKVSRPRASLNNDNKILVRLPSGPYPEDSTKTSITFPDTRDLVKHFPDVTFVDLQYRLGRKSNAQQELDHRFPTPIHDVFAAWDYIINKDSPHNRNSEGNVQQPKICLYGRNIGGALALTLALTNPTQIHAVAVQEPLVDWPILDELASIESDQPSNSSAGRIKGAGRKHDEREALAAAARELIKLRTRIFRTPSGYFDSFASPVLFLRAPGRDTPTTKTAMPLEEDLGVTDKTIMRYGDDEDDSETIEYKNNAFGPYDDDWHTIGIPSTSNKHTASETSSVIDSSPSTENSNTPLEQPLTDLSYWTPRNISEQPPSSSPRRRKVLRRWPPIAQPEDVVLPYINIILNKPDSSNYADINETHHTDLSPVLRSQGLELLELLRRACFWGREKSFAEERVTLTEISADNVKDQDKILEWLRMRLADG